MSRPETLATLWYVFFDTHVGVAKPYETNLITLFRRHSKFFSSIRVSLWLVVATKNLASEPDGHWFQADIQPV